MKRQKLLFVLIISLIFILSSCGRNENVVVQVDSGSLEIHYIDVGQGDSILILTETSSVLIDGGDRSYEEYLLEYLNSAGIEKFDYVVATHPHADHIGGLTAVINNFQVDNFMMPDKIATTTSFERMINALLDKNITIVEPVAGDEFFLNDLHFTVVAPNSKEYDNTNDYSIVLTLKHGENSFIFTGDAERVSEDEMLISYRNIRADVLKVGHHGSATSTSREFLEQVSPSIAVISVGAENTYNHPNDDVIELLLSEGVKVLRTDEYGNIIIRSDGINLTVETEYSFYKAPEKTVLKDGSDNKDPSVNDENSNNLPEKSIEPSLGEILYVDEGGNGLIKGNINRSGEKIYHMPNSTSYDRTIPELIFKSESEALEAGFRRALR